MMIMIDTDFKIRFNHKKSVLICVLSKTFVHSWQTKTRND